MNVPAGPIDPLEFALMRRYIESQCGLHLGDEKTYLVESRLTPLMAELGCRSFYELHERARADATRRLRDRIIDLLTTHETFWFRDEAAFAFLEGQVLPSLAAAAPGPGGARVWCAACSTGQEPYSVAITALEAAARARGPQAPQVEILATDVSTSALFLARAGRYDSFSMGRGMPPQLRDRYFTRSGDIWTIDERVKRLVRFEKHNLQDPFAALGRFDLVFCRNVLMYFADELKQDIVQRLREALRPGGHLVLGPTESPLARCERFDLVRHGQGLYYRAS